MCDPEALTVDRLLGGRLKLAQSRTGHRAGTDAVLLAAAAPAAGIGSFVDIGAGVGTAGLAYALRFPAAGGLLLEADAGSAALARRNATMNGLADRIGVIEADLFAGAACRSAGLIPESAALVLTNPPFYAGAAVRASPDPGRAAAHVLARGDHLAWMTASLALLAPKGRFIAIHRPEALPDLLAAAAGRLGAVVVRPVQARRDGDATRILFAGVKGSRAPMRIAPPFVLHGTDGRFTPEAEAVHRGDSAIAL